MIEESEWRSSVLEGKGGALGTNCMADMSTVMSLWERGTK